MEDKRDLEATDLSAGLGLLLLLLSLSTGISHFAWRRQSKELGES